MQQSLDRVLTAAELSTCYLPGRTAATISKDLSRRPASLPPHIRIPGQRAALWLESTVLDWLRSHQLDPTEPARRRGRPTKREQIERRAHT